MKSAQADGSVSVRNGFCKCEEAVINTMATVNRDTFTPQVTLTDSKGNMLGFSFNPQPITIIDTWLVNYGMLRTVMQEEVAGLRTLTGVLEEITGELLLRRCEGMTFDVGVQNITCGLRFFRDLTVFSTEMRVVPRTTDEKVIKDITALFFEFRPRKFATAPYALPPR